MLSGFNFLKRSDIMIDEKDVFSAFSGDNNIGDIITKINNQISKRYHEITEYLLICDIIDIYNDKYKNYDDYKKHMEDIIEKQKNESDSSFDVLMCSFKLNINIKPIILSKSTYEDIKNKKNYDLLNNIFAKKEE